MTNTTATAITTTTVAAATAAVATTTSNTTTATTTTAAAAITTFFLPKSLSKEKRGLALKIFWKKDTSAVLRQWNENLESGPSSSKHIYRLREKLEEHGTVSSPQEIADQDV
jgi:hypothetical protein